jgi:hypothetical protein
MRKIRSIFIISNIFILIILGAALFTENNYAQHSQGPLTISGRVYDSEGEYPGDGFEGTYAAVMIEQDGERRTYEDAEGLTKDDSGDYWYTVTIPANRWGPGDRFWIIVDGTGWGDLDAECVDHDNPEESSWVADSSAENQDVNTVNTIRVVNGGSPPGLVFFILMGVIVIAMVIMALLLLRPKSGSIPPRTRF